MYILLSELCQCTHSLDAVESHDEALQFPHVLDHQSKAGLYSPDVLHLVILDFSEKCFPISEEVLHEFLDRPSNIPVRKNLD